MMKTEMKWKWFKRFINLIMLIAGGLTGTSLHQWDLTLFAVSLILAVVVIQIQIMIGFIDALSDDDVIAIQGYVPKCSKCEKPMKLKLIPRPGSPPGNMWVCDCEEGS